MRVPAALLAIPLVIGCALGLLTGEHAPSSLPIAAAAAGLVALLATVAAIATQDDEDTDAAVVSVCVIVGGLVSGASLGVDAAHDAYRSPLASWFTTHRVAGPVIVLGVLRDDAATTATGVSLTLDVQALAPVSSSSACVSAAACEWLTRGGVRLSVAGVLAASEMIQWRAGRLVRVAATLREPTVYENPGVPDERRSLARRGVVLVGSAKSAAMVEVLGPGPAHREWASNARAWVRRVLAASVAPWSAQSAGVATAIAIGDRTGLSQEDEQRLQFAGTYHVIAISGGNIAILTLMMLGLARGLGVSPRVAAAASIGVLLLYGQVTGPAPSVDRAISAAVIFLAGRLVEERGPSLNILAVAAALGLVTAPGAVFDPGFLLSFGATLGILLGVTRLVSIVTLPLSPTRDVPHLGLKLARGAMTAAATMIAATLSAEIALMPIAASLFGRVTCAGLVLNFAAIPLMTVVQAGSMVVLGLSLINADYARACGFIVHLAARALVDSARLVDFAPWVARELPPPAWALVASYYAVVMIALTTLRLRRAALLAVASLGCAIVLGAHATARDAVRLQPRGTLRAVFLDVGQGDSTLLVLPDHRAVLIDAGGLPVAPIQDPADGPAFDIGERVVTRALRAFGVRSLDTFVLTHADPDHLGGALSVLRSFRPRAIWDGVPVPRHDGRQRLVEESARLGAEWRTIQAGDVLQVAGVEITALHPPRPEWERQRVRNDDSIVLDVRIGDVSLILPGDIGREGEASAQSFIRPAGLTLLKAPHHGSATSSTEAFLNEVRPAVVIFSAGRGNRFNHPAPIVRDRYRRLGAIEFTTASDGAVILDTDGKSIHVRTWMGREMRMGVTSVVDRRSLPTSSGHKGH